MKVPCTLAVIRSPLLTKGWWEGWGWKSLTCPWEVSLSRFPTVIGFVGICDFCDGFVKLLSVLWMACLFFIGLPASVKGLLWTSFVKSRLWTGLWTCRFCEQILWKPLYVNKLLLWSIWEHAIYESLYKNGLWVYQSVSMLCDQLNLLLWSNFACYVLHESLLISDKQ